MAHVPDYKGEAASDAKRVPQRVAFIKRRTAPRVREVEEEMEMTIPHLVVREIIAFEVLIIGLALLSLLFNAPLEWIANPLHTPNPAKAPWYFLGLQELLHYFPPIVAGVLLPTLAVIALIIIPYVPVNIKRESLWDRNRPRRLAVLLIVTGLISLFLILYSVYAMLVPTLVIVCLMVVPFFVRRERGFAQWLGARTLAWWIMTWFVSIVVILTVIGTLFRGPEWSWVWPWNGIY